MQNPYVPVVALFDSNQALWAKKVPQGCHHNFVF